MRLEDDATVMNLFRQKPFGAVVAPFSNTTSNLNTSLPIKNPISFTARCFVLAICSAVQLGAAQDGGPTGPSQNSSARLGLLDAVRITLSSDPKISLVEKDAQAARGRILAAQGQYDIQLNSSISQGLEERPYMTSPFDYERQILKRTSLRVGASKLLPMGITVTPALTVNRLNDSLGLGPGSQSEAGVDITIPLARGLGVKATTADERAAKTAYNAAKLQVQHTIALRTMNTASAFWAFLSASRRLEVLRLSEQRARELMENTRALVNAKEVPSAEMEQLVANLADKRASRISATQAALEAQHQLGLAMGLPFDQILAMLPPGEEFPSAIDDTGRLQNTSSSLAAIAIQKRADYAAAQLSQDASKILADLARHRLKPQVDLVLHGGYAGMNTGGSARSYFNSIGDHIEGPLAMATLNFGFPVANRSARGNLIQQEAYYQQSVINAEDLARGIQSSVTIALERVRNAAEELKESEKAMAQYLIALENEKSKRKLSMSTLIDVIVTEDRLTGAAIGNIGAQSQYAIGIIQLRFETGTLLNGGSRNQIITREQLITLPAEAFQTAVAR
jgi:outer membrane protein TolC